MSKATDYIIVNGWQNAYFAKKSKRNNLISQDRRVITDNEIIGLFEFYLRRWYENHKSDENLVITNADGKELFEARLLDTSEPLQEQSK